MKDDPAPDPAALNPATPDPTDGRETAPRATPISSEQLLGGQREIVIQHGAEQYRLRLTNSNKLILVK